jgi:hypothetical protein
MSKKETNEIVAELENLLNEELDRKITKEM